MDARFSSGLTTPTLGAARVGLASSNVRVLDKMNARGELVVVARSSSPVAARGADEVTGSGLGARGRAATGLARDETIEWRHAGK